MPLSINTMARCYVGQQEHALLHKNVAEFHSTKDGPRIYYARINEDMLVYYLLGNC